MKHNEHYKHRRLEVVKETSSTMIVLSCEYMFTHTW